MSILVQRPNHEVFLKLPDITDAVADFKKRNIEASIKSIGNIFVQHKMHQHFGISINHRHFDMSHDQVLVETVNASNTVSVSIPWTLSGDLASPSYLSDLAANGLETDCRKKYVIPNNWRFDDKGDLEPFEFLATDEPHVLQPTDEFAKDLFEALSKLGIQDAVGLRRAVVINSSAWETTAKGSRANVVSFGDIPENVVPEKMIQVVWMFDQNGNFCKTGGFCQDFDGDYDSPDSDEDD